MATETEIPESVYLKKGEREDDVLTESFEEKVTDVGNKVAETVNTLETGKSTNESETFIQALSVPMVTSNTLESCDAITTQDQEESKTTKNEDFKPNVDELVKAVSTLKEPEEEEEATENKDKYDEKAIEKKTSEGIGPDKAESELGLKLSENMLEKDQGPNDDVISSQDATLDDIKEKTIAEHTTTVADFKEQHLIEKPREFLKEDTEEKVIDAPEVCEQSENETKENREEKPDVSVKKTEEEEDNEEIMPGVQIEEQNGMPHNITTESEVKATEDDGNNEEEADSPSIKEVCEETGEKVEYDQEQAVNLLEEDKNIEMEQEVIMLKKDQEKDEVINVKDVKFEEKIQQSEDNDHEVVKAKESIEEDTEEVRIVETPEKTEQQRLINAIPTDVCIATQIEPEEKVTENDERYDDGQTKESEKAESEEGLKLPDSSTITLKENEATSQDDDQLKEAELYVSEKGQTQSLAEEEHEEEVTEIKDGKKENCDNLLIKEAFKETDSVKVDFESVEVSNSSSSELKEKTVDILSKDEAEEKKQELNIAEQTQEQDIVTGSQDATLEVGETIKENPKDVKTENVDITPDDSMSSQAEFQEEVIKNEEKPIEVEVKAIQSDGDQKEMSENLFVKKVCEETDLKQTEAADSSNMLVSSQDAAPEEDLQEKSYYNEDNKAEIVETREDVDEIEANVNTEEETEQQKLLHVITTDSYSSAQTEVPAETFEIEEKNEEAIENDDGQNLESIEKEQELSMSEVQGGGDDLETSQKEDEKKEEIGQQATTVEAENIGETTKNIIKDETETIEVQEAKRNEDGAYGEGEQMPEGIVNKNLHSCVEIEQDRHTEEIIPSVESKEEEDVFFSTQTEFPEEATKKDEKATETDSVRKEKSDNPFDETDSECEKGTVLPETSSLIINEKSIPVVTKDEDQEKEQEHKDETADYEENLQEKRHGGEGNEDKILEEEQEKEPEKKYQNESNEAEVAETGGCVDDNTEEIKSSVETKDYAETKPIEKEESKDGEAIENDDDQTTKSEIPLVKEVCEATISDKAESEEAVKLSDSIGTTLEENEMSKEENLQQEEEIIIAKTEEIIKEEAEDESIDAQKANQQCENDPNDKAEQNPEESVDKSVNSCSEIVEGNVKEDEGSNKEIEAKLDADQIEMKDEKMPSEVGQSKEQYVEVFQTCLTESLGEKTEDEITNNKNLSDDKIEDKDGNNNTEDKNFLDERTREIEVSTLEHPPVEEKNDDLDEESKENFIDLKESGAVEPQEDSTPSNSLETSTEDSSNLERVNTEREKLPKDDLEAGSEVQIPKVLPTDASETTMIEDEEERTTAKDISSDEKQAAGIMQETFKEVSEETSSEKAVLEERLKLSDSSSLEINEKAVAFGDEDQEKDQDVSISIEGQGKDNVTSLHDAVSEKENLGDEHEFLETRESVDEDTKETESSIESKENEFETPLIKEVCETTTLEKDESEAYNTIPDENEIASKEENLEKEEVQGDGDDVTSINKVIKETSISQPANTVGNFEEGQYLSVVTKEIIEEEAIDAQEVNKECQDGAKDESEKNHEESVDKPVVEGYVIVDEADVGDNNVIEAKLEAENQADRTEDRVEIEDEVVSEVTMPSELGQPREPSVEEIETCLSTTMTEKTEDETTKKENDSSHDSTEDTNGNTTIEEKRAFEHEPTEEQKDGVAKEILTDLNETATMEPQDITPSSALGTSIEDTSNSEKAKAESEHLPTEDIVEEQIPEVLPKSQDLTIATHVDEETATKEISSDQVSEKLYISTEENVTELEQIAENNSTGERDPEEDVTQGDQLDSTENCSETAKDVILTKEMTSEIQDTERTDFEEKVVDKESYSQNQEEKEHEISYPDPIPVGKPEMTEVAEGISCESKVKNDSIDEAPKEEQIPSLEDAAVIEPEVDLSKIESTAYPSESEKTPIEALEPACNVQTSEVITESEDSKVKEERIVLETVGHTDEDKVEEEQTITSDEISSAPDTEAENERSSFLQNTEEKSLSKEVSEKLYISTEENVTELEQIAENNATGERDPEEDVTQGGQLNSTQDCSETVKDVILTKEMPSEIQETERTDFEEKVVDKESYSQNQEEKEHEKEEQIPSLEDAAVIEREVDLSKIESTAYPSESEKSPIQALEPDCNVQNSGVITESEASEVKEERNVIETVGHTDEDKVEEEQTIRSDEILSAPSAEEENERSSFLQNTEEKSLSKEKLELPEEVKPTPESMIVEVQFNETKSQQEHSDITSENIMNGQTLESKLEHTEEQKLEDVKRDLEEDVTQESENQTKGIEENDKTEKNVILTDQVVVEPTKENEEFEFEGQVFEEDSSTTKLNTTSTSNQMDLTNEIECSKGIPVGNTEETEMKAESHLELGNIPAVEDLDYLSKTSSTLEASNMKRGDGTEESKDGIVYETSKDEVLPVVEDITELELEANLPDINSTDIPSDSMKLAEGIPCSTQETVEVKDDELISEIETHEALVKMEEHPETNNDTCDTPTAGVSNEKLLDEPEKLDAKDDTEGIAQGDEKALEASYQDAMTGVTGHEHFPQTKELTEKLESMIPSEEPTAPAYEDQTKDLTLGTDETKVEHGSLSNKDNNPELEEEEFMKPLSQDHGIKERYVEDTEEKSGNEEVDNVIVNEVPMKDETTEEILSIKDNNNEKAIQNQPMSVTQEVSQIEILSSSPDELLEKKDLTEDAETLEIKDKTLTVMKESNEAIDIPATEVENSESMVTEENITEADADKEKNTLTEPRAENPAEAVCGSISSSLKEDIDVRSEESKGHGDTNKPEEQPAEAFEITSEVTEIVPDDSQVSAISTDGILETSPEMLLAKHDPKLTTTPEKIEDEIKDKEVACESTEKTGEIQVSTLDSEIVEGKQHKLVDPPSYVEIKDQVKLTHYGSQEGNALLSRNEKKIEDSVTLQSVEKEMTQGLDKGFEEAPVQKNEKGFDQITTVDVVNNAECSEVEPPKLDTNKETFEFVNEEIQRDQKNEHKVAATSIEDVKSSTPEVEVPSVKEETADKEGYYEDPEDNKYEEAEKGILIDNKYTESTFGISKPTEEVMQEALEVDAPTTLSTEATKELKISHDQVEPTERSFTADAEDLNASKVSVTEAQCGSEVTQDEKKTSDEENKSESAEGIIENINKEMEPKDEQIEKEETDDAPVMVEASDVKVHKKSHNMLSGVGSKVKHSIAKVKKAITGKSFHPKPTSP